MAEKRRWSKANVRRWGTVAGVIVVLGGGAGAWAATRSSGPTYRLTAAGPAEVSSVLPATGTIQSVNQATLRFPVSGQVSAVNVQIGQQVTQGQVLATLDTTSLATQVSSAQARAATAQAKLATDENGQNAAAGGGGGGAASGARSGGSSGGTAPGGGRPAGPPPEVTSGQNAVKNAQHQVDADLAADNTAIRQEKAACAQTTTTQSSSRAPSSSTSPTTSASPSTSASPPASSSGSSGSGGESGPTSDCTALIQQVLGDQSKTAADEQALADAENGLTTALSQATAATAGGGSAPPASSGKSSPPAGGTPAPTGGRTQAPASAEQLAADQASVDATNADLDAANQNLSAATLTSPIAGTVAQVGITAGQSVSGAATQNDIVVLGPGTDEVTTTVSDVQVQQVHTGQSATITPDGTSLRLAGEVTQVGVLGSTSSSGAVTYPVTISLAPTSQQLFAGGTAAVSINTGSTRAAVAVPTSAVHTAGSRQFVSVLRNGQTTLAPVTVGVVGATLTEIRSGLQAGDQVVIADLKAPLPTSTTGLRGFGGGGGARPGGGGAGAGAGGAGGGARPGG